MARTSRKTSTVQEVAVQQNIYPTAIYVRLSVENSGKTEKVNVITNQIEICKNYIEECPYLDLVDTYIDNGITGTVFDRPQFNRLMDDIRSGKIKCLVVRDLSRFGRDYIETGTYLERVFPQIGLRFISVKERYDSFDTDQTNEALLIPLQNMINALYSKDISRKVSTALRAKMQDGTFAKRNLPYGYMWNDEHTQSIVDEVVAPFVKLIFKWKLEGVSLHSMTEQLEKMNAPTAKCRKYENGVRNGKESKEAHWRQSTIANMLVNPHYVGDSVLGRSIRALYKGVKPQKVTDKEEWIIFPNAHEALISREDFDAVQEIMEKASETWRTKLEQSEKMRKQFINLLDNKIFCADCGKKMYYKRLKLNYSACKVVKEIWQPIYNCSTNVRRMTQKCTPHNIQQRHLEEKILSAIKMQVKVALDYEKLLIKLRDSEGKKSIINNQNALVTSLNLKLNSIQKKRARLYEDFTDGILNEEEYLFAKQSFNEEYENLNLRLEEAISRRSKFNDAMSSGNQWINLMKSVSRSKKLTQSLVDEAIERVNVFEGGTIELVMKYSDVYAITVASVKEVQESVA